MTLFLGRWKLAARMLLVGASAGLLITLARADSGAAPSPLAAAKPGLTIVLTSVPTDTPKDAALYVTGSFNGWQTAIPEYRLTPLGEGKYTLALPAHVYGHIEFKFTLGSWDLVEQDTKGADVTNRTFEVPASSSATYTGTVLKWRLPARTIEELKKELEKIMAETHTPGVSVAIVRRDGPEWVAGLGQADVASGRATTADTLFRIGSVSKAFAGLAILKLEQEGKLSLQDPVRKLIPEVWFENRWEATDPVRVVDLLEHTTGWDDMHLKEYAKNADGLTTAEGLDYYHHSRISRWRPGTRMSYCNSGPAVAALIVEKITGERFEDYVTRNLFLPMGMKTATYFQPIPGQASTLYHSDGRTPHPYWHILVRPAGAINCSANDMAAYLAFYLHRGSVHGVPVVPAALIDRMELPTRSWGAQEGMTQGYGIYNYPSIVDGFIYHGHNGGVEGGLTMLAYLSQPGVGYSISINSGNGYAIGKINQAVRVYIAQGLPKLPIPPATALPKNAEEYAGWYEPASPRNESFHFMDRLQGLTRVTFQEGKAHTTSVLKILGHSDDTLTPIGGKLFRGETEPVGTAVLITPNPEGRFIAGKMGTMKQLPTWLAWTEIGLTAWFLLAVAAVVIHAPFWLLAGLRPKWRRPQERWIKVWPLVAVVGLFAIIAVFSLAGEDMFGRLGNLTVWSFGLFAATLVSAGASLAGALALWRDRNAGVRKFTYRYAFFVTGGLLVATVYLTYWGVIGIRCWD